MTKPAHMLGVLLTVGDDAPYMPLKACLYCEGLRRTRVHKCQPCLDKVISYNKTVQRKALRIVARAVRHGKLPRPSAFQCVDCGAAAQQYDHRDYSRPLDVAPVCKTCNLRRGPAAQYPLTKRAAA